MMTDMHATIKVLLEPVFSTQSVQRGYKEDNWGNRVSSVWEPVKEWNRRKEALHLEPFFSPYITS
jgi:hypothetical protein